MVAPETFTYVADWHKNRELRGWWHSFELPNGTTLNGVCSVESLKSRIGQFPIPDDLRGKRVLDIGAWDGWFSFEMERRGASVVAIDCWDNPRFHQMKRTLGSSVEYRLLDIYDVTPETVGHFDIVLFMGVLYHLKHPLLALERVCSVTTDMAVVDSFVLRERHRPGENVESRPVMEFYETDEFGGQTDNWCGPSLPCLMAMCRTAGFARVEHRATLEHSACVACFRKWPEEDIAGRKTPTLIFACHHTNFGINFQSRQDEYLTAVFTCATDGKGAPRIEPEVDQYGVSPINKKIREPGVWQATFKLPPGLNPGWHDVRVRVDGVPSGAQRVAVDIPLPKASVRITGVSDGTTWQPGILDRTRGNCLVVWIEGLPENADRANVKVMLGGEPVEVVHVSPADRQINLNVPTEAPAGFYELETEIGGTRSQPFPVEIKSSSF